MSAQVTFKKHKHDASSYMRHLSGISNSFDACFVCFKSAALDNNKEEMEKYLQLAKLIFDKINFNFAGSFQFMQKVTANFSRCSVDALTDILAAYDVENREKIKEIELKILDAMTQLYKSKEITELEIKVFNTRTADPFQEFVEREKDLIQKYGRCLRDANNTLTLLLESDSSPTRDSLPSDHPLNGKIQALSDRILSNTMIDGKNPECYLCYYEGPTLRDPAQDEDPSFLSETESDNYSFPVPRNQQPQFRQKVASAPQREPIRYSHASNSDEDPILSTEDEIYEAKRASRRAKRDRSRNTTTCCIIC